MPHLASAGRQGVGDREACTVFKGAPASARTPAPDFDGPDSTLGARQFCAIRNYLSTATKHGLGAFDALVMLTKDRPWMPAA